MIDEPWYAAMAERYGEEFCAIAGYFEETQKWSVPYGDVFDLPAQTSVIQFSGAFHPFHEGHLSAIEQAIEDVQFRADSPSMPFDWRVTVVLHVDHSEYRNSKGKCDEAAYAAGIELFQTLSLRWGVDTLVVEEDRMPNGCSRNFTRLYSELVQRDNLVYFLSGGDRANFALTFIDDGYCIISGRDQHDRYRKYSYLERRHGKNIRFLSGNNPESSTEVRRRIKLTRPVCD